MDKATAFLLNGVGVKERHLDVLARIQSIAELDDLSFDDETVLCGSGDVKRASKVVLEAEVRSDYYSSEAVETLMGRYGLQPAVQDFSHQPTALIYLTFIDEASQPDETCGIHLYLRCKE